MIRLDELVTKVRTLLNRLVLEAYSRNCYNKGSASTAVIHMPMRETGNLMP